MSNTALMRRGDFGDAYLARFFVEKYEIREGSTGVDSDAVLSHRVWL